MSYRIARIDVHKKMLAVVVADVEIEGEYQFERRQFGSTPEHLRLLAEWLLERGAEEEPLIRKHDSRRCGGGPAARQFRPVVDAKVLQQARQAFVTIPISGDLINAVDTEHPVAFGL
jgi:hypothetical protein